MSLRDLYALAYGPLKGDPVSVENEENSKDIVSEPQKLIEDIEFVNMYASKGLEMYKSYLSSPNLNKRGMEEGVALYCLTDYLERLRTSVAAVNSRAAKALHQGYGDTSISLRELGSSVQNIIPQDENIRSLFDGSAAASEWLIPANTKGRVLFRKSVSVVAGDAANSCEETGIHEPIDDGTKFKRKEVRKATGYVKITFKGNDDTDDDGESERAQSSPESKDISSNNNDSSTGCSKVVVEHEPLKSGPSVVRRGRKATGYANFNFKESSDEDDDYSNEPTTSTQSGGERGCNSGRSSRSSTSTSKYNNSGRDSVDGNGRSCNENSSSSGDNSSSLNGWCFNMCGARPKEEEELVHTFKRSGSVGIGGTTQIQDTDADVHWNEELRHKTRMDRLRNRRPTGHPVSLASLKAQLHAQQLEEDEDE